MGPEYRATVFAYGQPVGGTVLTPRAGSAHTDGLRISTIASSGFLPYMDPPKGRRGKIELLTRKVDTGSLTVRILDKRTGASNGVRWLTAFAGDAQGWEQLKGCLVLFEESIDGGGTWNDYFVGSIEDWGLTSALFISMTVAENGRLLDDRVFEGRPHRSVSEAKTSPLLPNALVDAYGPFAPAPKLKGTLRQFTWTNVGTYWTIEIDPLANTVTDVDHQATVVTKRLFDDATAAMSRPRDPLGLGFGLGTPTSDLVRVEVDFTSGTLNGQSGHYWLSPFVDVLGRVEPFKTERDDYGHERVKLVGITPMVDRPTDPDYIGLGSAGDTVEFALRSERPTKEGPIYVDYADGLDFLRDLLDGYYSRLDGTGAVTITYPYENSSFTAITRDVGPYRAQFPKAAKLNDVVEEFCRERELAYRFDESGRFVLIDLALPSSLAGIPTLTDADIMRGEVAAFRTKRATAITDIRVITFHEERDQAQRRLLTAPEGYVDEPPTGIRETKREIVPFPFGRTGLGKKSFEIVARGLRSSNVVSGLSFGLWNDEVVARHRALSLALSYESRFGTGLAEVPVVCRRTTLVNALQLGDLLIAGPAEVPNPASNERGGNRLYRVVGETDEGARRSLSLADEGPATVSVVPVIGALSLKAGSGRSAIVIPVTLNAAGDRVRLDVAPTDTATGTRPLDSSDRWVQVGTASASGSAEIYALPSSRRVWVRARSEADPTIAPKLPSSWVYPSGNGYVDTDALPAVGSLQATALNGSEVELEWLETDTFAGIEVLIDGTRVDLLKPGARRYTARGLAASTQYAFTVRYRDDWGGVGADSVVNSTTTGTPGVAPIPIGISILVGDRV